MLTGKACAHAVTEQAVAGHILLRTRADRVGTAALAKRRGAPRLIGGAQAARKGPPSPPKKTTTTTWRRGGRWPQQGARTGDRPAPQGSTASEAELPRMRCRCAMQKRERRLHRRSEAAPGRCEVWPQPLPTQCKRRERPQCLEEALRFGPRRSQAAHESPAACSTSRRCCRTPARSAPRCRGTRATA